MTSEDRVLQVRVADGGVEVIHEGLEGAANPVLGPSGESLVLTQGDAVLRLDLGTGELRDIASGVLPGRLGLNVPGGNWLTFQTRDAHLLVDARTGEIVSRVDVPGNRASDTFAPHERAPGYVDADGDTVVVAEERPGNGPLPVESTIWIASPLYPSGLEISGPEPELSTGFVLAPDGRALYAWTSERLSGPSDLWVTSLGTEPAWMLVAEDVAIRTFLPLPAGSR
jgi:hypothetical protein